MKFLVFLVALLILTGCASAGTTFDNAHNKVFDCYPVDTAPALECQNGQNPRCWQDIALPWELFKEWYDKYYPIKIF